MNGSLYKDLTIHLKYRDKRFNEGVVFIIEINFCGYLSQLNCFYFSNKLLFIDKNIFLIKIQITIVLNTI